MSSRIQKFEPNIQQVSFVRIYLLFVYLCMDGFEGDLRPTLGDRLFILLLLLLLTSSDHVQRRLLADAGVGAGDEHRPAVQTGCGLTHAATRIVPAARVRVLFGQWCKPKNTACYHDAHSQGRLVTPVIHTCTYGYAVSQWPIGV